MVPLCREILKDTFVIYIYTLSNKFYNLSSSDLISNNCDQFPTYTGTRHLSPLAVFFFAKDETDKNIFNTPYIKNVILAKLKTFWKCNFPLKLLREVVFCRKGITYSFYFNYFYFILLLQKIITSLQKNGG